MINYLIHVTCVFVYPLISQEKFNTDRFIAMWFIINDLGSLTIHVNKKIISLSSKRCKTMIQYGSYLHKSRVIVFMFSDSTESCTNQWFITVPFLLSVFSEIKRLACCGIWLKRDPKSHNLILLFNKKNAYVLFRALRKSVSFWKTCFWSTIENVHKPNF